MNPLDWRTRWDLELITREQREARLEQERVARDAGVVPGGTLAPLWRGLGTALVAAGQWLAAEPGKARLHAPTAV